MARTDLPHGYGGWQAFDCTPKQQTADRMMQCGPSSIEAVRRNEVGFAFDTPSLYAEVNADICHFQEDDASHWGFKKIKLSNYSVGRQILTKRAGADDDVADADVEDITSLYKNVEGVVTRPTKQQADGCFNSLFTQGVAASYGERDIMHYPGSPVDQRRSVLAVDRAPPIYEFPAKVADDVFFDLVELDKVAFGQPFSVTIHVQNRATEIRSVAAILSASSIYYTGVPARRLGRTDRQLVLQPGQRETLQVRVSWDEYRDKVVDYGMIKIYALASVAETKQTWSEEDDFQLEKPKLDVQVCRTMNSIQKNVRGAAQVGQDCFVTFSFLNPLSVNLTECEFTFEGPGLVRPQTIKYRDVKMGEMVSHVQKFTPRQSGERKLVATFSSRELIDVIGSRPVLVRD